VILKVMPNGASAPDRGTHVGKAEEERPDKKQLPAYLDAKVATPPPESDAEGSQPLNYSYQRNQRPYASPRGERTYY
jgi:hypothetical protein